MEIYLVGGAVRDTLLGLPVKDRDWVVVGASPQQLVDRGFVPVGKDFPVFLHPASKEEYALARTERNSAPGYKGFTVHAAPDVTLEQDLARRDLTINAMAVSRQQLADDGSFDPASVTLDDPYHGQRDLQRRVLRHVTDAFHDDPVRILRVARFAARFDDFRVADETLTLMRSMVANGEVDALVAERVWQELARGLMEDTPSRMLQVLADCDALAHLLPELTGTPAEAGSAVQLGARLIDEAACEQAPLSVRFASLCRAVADPSRITALCARLRAPNDCRDLALLAARESAAIDDSGDRDAAGLVALIERCDALRKPARFHELLQVCAIGAIVDARIGADAYPPLRRLHTALAAAQAVPTDAIARREMAAGRSGPAVGAAIHAARVEAVAAAVSAA
ncbi:MAG: multifunctional CCA tRNA nucleotidyl transferase/2'3'-cyclic phosphodiesterase/2'nucleotidase/phosphatase [Rhodoferax sp.]|nr:multifunctional CCA tRNA nucleotidyl transferase/2'3'-cyclic phosphodiesterase/2'nucleotidase/phosphatase [Rhodoferax sp.]